MTARAALRSVKKSFAATPLAWGFVVPIVAVAVLWLTAPRQLAPHLGWLLGSAAWSLVVVWLSVAPLARLCARNWTLLQFVALVVIVAIECAIAARVAASKAWLWHFLLFLFTAIPTLLTAKSCERCKRIAALRGLAFKGETRTTYSADATGRPLKVVVKEGTNVSACAYCGASATRAIKRELPVALVIALALLIWPYLLWHSRRTRLVPGS